MKKLTHYEKIRQVLDYYGIEDSEAESMCGFGVGTISKKKDTNSKLFENNVKNFLRRFHVARSWWDHGEGEMLSKKVDDIRGISAHEPALSYTKDESINEEIYKKIVEGNTEYLLIPRSVLKENYRLKSLEEYEKEKEDAIRLDKERENQKQVSEGQDRKIQLLMDIILQENREYRAMLVKLNILPDIQQPGIQKS